MKFIKLLPVLAMLFAFSSCGDDEPNVSENPDNTFYDNDKEYLANTARDFMNYFKVSDQRELIETLSHICNKYEDYEFPDNFTEEDGAYYNSALKKMLKSYAEGNLMSMARSTVNYTFNMARFRGIYEPNDMNEEWVKVGNSNDVVLRIPYNGDKVVATLKGTGGEWDYDWTEEDWDWDYWYGEYLKSTNNYHVVIPKTATLTFTKGSKTLLTAVVKSDFVNGSRASVNAVINAMNLTLNLDSNATPSTVTENQTFAVNGTTILTTSAKATGKNICSSSTWENNDVDDIMTGGECTVKVLNRVTIKGKITNVPDFYRYVDYYVDNYDTNDPETAAKNAAKSLNSSMEAKLYYAGSSTVRGTLSWRAYQSYFYNDYYWGYTYNEWSVEPMITFTSDDTPYTFEGYFGGGKFASIENQFNHLYDLYETAWSN